MTHDGRRPGWRAAEWLSTWLDESEREAVLGDLDETHASAARACLEVAGLVARRSCGSSLRFTLTAGMLVAIAIAVGYVSKFWAGGVAAQVWFLAGHDALRDSIWRTGQSQAPAGAVVLQWTILNLVTLGFWSFAAGSLLQTMNGAQRWVAGIAAYAATIVAAMFAHTLGAAPMVPPAVMSAAVALHTGVAVVTPALCGFEASRRRIRVAPPLAFVIFGIGVALTARAAADLELAVVGPAFGLSPLMSSPAPSLAVLLTTMLSVVVVWPLVILLRRSFPAPDGIQSLR